MGWFLSLVMIAILLAFNMFAADTIIRLRSDVKDIHKAVVTDAVLVNAATTPATTPAAAAAAAAAAPKLTLPIVKK
jgi:hypothetical protein